jgi:hypothetical protein
VHVTAVPAAPVQNTRAGGTTEPTSWHHGPSQPVVVFLPWMTFFAEGFLATFASLSPDTLPGVRSPCDGQ